MPTGSRSNSLPNDKNLECFKLKAFADVQNQSI